MTGLTTHKHVHEESGEPCPNLPLGLTLLNCHDSPEGATKLRPKSPYGRYEAVGAYVSVETLVETLPLLEHTDGMSVLVYHTSHTCGTSSGTQSGGYRAGT